MNCVELCRLIYCYQIEEKENDNERKSKDIEFWHNNGNEKMYSNPTKIIALFNRFEDYHV